MHKMYTYVGMEEHSEMNERIDMALSSSGDGSREVVARLGRGGGGGDGAGDGSEGGGGGGDGSNR